jgi:hypothetical protein
MNTFRDIIDLIGSARLAKILNVPPGNVRLMRHRDSIPPQYWATLVSLPTSKSFKGVSFQALSEMRRKRFLEAAE